MGGILSRLALPEPELERYGRTRLDLADQVGQAALTQDLARVLVFYPASCVAPELVEFAAKNEEWL